jgi:hypothetical protein
MSGAAPHLIHNARVQLLATAFNNIGVGSIVAGIVAPLVTGSGAGTLHFLEWLAGGAMFLLFAQVILGRLR